MQLKNHATSVICIKQQVHPKILNTCVGLYKRKLYECALKHVISLAGITLYDR
jgi:hypothetical protein